MKLNISQIQALAVKLAEDINKELREKYKHQINDYITENKKQYKDFLYQFDNTIVLLKAEIIRNLSINIDNGNYRSMDINNYEDVLQECFIAKYAKINLKLIGNYGLYNEITLATIDAKDLDTLSKNITAKYI